MKETTTLMSTTHSAPGGPSPAGPSPTDPPSSGPATHGAGTAPKGGSRPAATSHTAPAAPPLQHRLAAGAALAIVGLVSWVLLAHGAQQAVLAGLGVALGLTLYHARFGFTSSFRQLLSVGQGEGLRAHALMLATASVLFAPILLFGSGLFGVETAGYLAPVGVSVVVGAFLFGIGMQLGGACASGTLFAVGGGHTAVAITLVSFIAGSVLGAWHWGWWTQELAWLGFGPVSLADTPAGAPGGLALTLLALGLVWWWAGARTRRTGAPARSQPPSAAGFARVLRGSWPLWVGALALAGLNALVLLTSGRPWGVTGAFALWGSRIAESVGVPVRSWAYWQGDRALPLDAPLLADTTTLLNVGIILGALLAAAVGGTFALHRRLPARTVAAAVLGGLLMGYGARLAYGCNIGAYFGGIASGSLHGWLWGALALAGTYVGLRVRPWFGLRNPKPSDSVC